MDDKLRIAYQAEHVALTRWFSIKPETEPAEIQQTAYELRLAMQHVDKLLKGTN